MVSPDTHGDQKRVSDVLDLELQAIISLLMWVPGIKRGTFGKEASILNHRVALPALVIKYDVETRGFFELCQDLFINFYFKVSFADTTSYLL